FPDVVTLPYVSGGAIKDWPEDGYRQGERLMSAAVKKTSRSNYSENQKKLLNRYWKDWVEPVLSEHAALREWDVLLEGCIKDSLKNYQRDYLDHPHHYETFQNALAELLTLLEIPGIAKLLVKTRSVLTWPVKKVFGMAKARKRLGSSDSSHEVSLLNQQADHLLIQLADRILEKIESEPEKSHWWKEINSLLRKRRPDVLQRFESAVCAYHIDFQQEIESAAHRLYDKLKEQPLTLNSLRATRVTTDAAAIALALQAGGIGLHDLVIMPAMLSVTSLLAESAMGGYMSRVEAELKHKQLETVKQTLFVDALKNQLKKLPESMGQTTQFNITLEQLSAAEEKLKEKPHGLRLF
ncbi:MAG: GTP-binding protein, partial [Gammaproteobacteria bacterium]